MSGSMKNDLAIADYLELAAGWHVLCVLADPSKGTRKVYCACGWQSKPEKCPYDSYNFESLVPQVKVHFKEAMAEAEKLRKEIKQYHQQKNYKHNPPLNSWQLRWQRWTKQSAVDFFHGVNGEYRERLGQ